MQQDNQMPIDLKNASTYVVCERCGVHGPVIKGTPHLSIEPAYVAAEKAGWKIHRDYDGGPRHTYCPDCQPYQVFPRKEEIK
jgi:hypothetical protein